MDEKMKEMLNGVIEKLNDEQKEKVKQCKTMDEFMALAGEWGIEIPDDMVDAAAGGFHMKTGEEFYKEIAASTELQSELKAASDEMIAAFLKKHGCDADVKDFTAFVKSQSEGEIEDDEAEAAAGGIMVKPITHGPESIKSQCLRCGYYGDHVLKGNECICPNCDYNSGVFIVI